MVVYIWRSYRVAERTGGCLFLITDTAINGDIWNLCSFHLTCRNTTAVPSVCIDQPHRRNKKTKRVLMHQWNGIILLNNSHLCRYSHCLKSLHGIAEGKWELKSLVWIDKSHQTPEGSPNFRSNHSTPWAGRKQWQGINTCNWEKAGQETAGKPHKWVTSPPDSKWACNRLHQFSPVGDERQDGKGVPLVVYWYRSRVMVRKKGCGGF